MCATHLHNSQYKTVADSCEQQNEISVVTKNDKFHDRQIYSRVIKTDYALVTCLLNFRYPKLCYPKFHKISRLLFTLTYPKFHHTSRLLFMLSYPKFHHISRFYLRCYPKFHHILRLLFTLNYPKFHHISRLSFTQSYPKFHHISRLLFTLLPEVSSHLTSFIYAVT